MEDSSQPGRALKALRGSRVPSSPVIRPEATPGQTRDPNRLRCVHGGRHAGERRLHGACPSISRPRCARCSPYVSTECICRDSPF
ncbi:hypothetical protein EYF80_034625 [Liparis tanakae]|uniref:Uncharacterized protein n=1 Tax=Liparis tanakae TaxID=230148 RepID=A0A4Z2GPL2_9TELE|nr:hypothetical protein EYF80_034625 [Liparis tanakae]